MVTHHLSDLIPEIDRVVLIDHGRIVADGPKREILVAPRLSQLFGLPLISPNATAITTFGKSGEACLAPTGLWGRACPTLHYCGIIVWMTRSKFSRSSASSLPS